MRTGTKASECAVKGITGPMKAHILAAGDQESIKSIEVSQQSAAMWHSE